MMGNFCTILKFLFFALTLVSNSRNTSTDIYFTVNGRCINIHTFSVQNVCKNAKFNQNRDLKECCIFVKNARDVQNRFFLKFWFGYSVWNEFG